MQEFVPTEGDHEDNHSVSDTQTIVPNEYDQVAIEQVTGHYPLASQTTADHDRPMITPSVWTSVSHNQ